MGVESSTAAARRFSGPHHRRTSASTVLKLAKVALPLGLILSCLAAFTSIEVPTLTLKGPRPLLQTKQRGPLADVGQPERAAAVVAAMRHAWGGYVEYAWGSDELQPVSKKGTKTYGGLAATIIDSMSTLHMMGLSDEFNRARDWVVQHARFDVDTDISFFEITIRVLGGLLSAHQLSGDPALLDRARDLGDRLLPIFNVSKTGIPDSAARLPVANTGRPDGVACLAEVGSDTLEFGALSALTGDHRYIEGAERGIRALHANYPDRGLLSYSVDRSTAREVGSDYSIGPRADSYYEYLLKWYLLGGKKDPHWLRRWELAVDDILRTLLLHAGSGNASLSFVGEQHSGRPTEYILPHLACYFGGNLALGLLSGVVSTPERRAAYFDLARNMTHACRAMYSVGPLGLAPDTVDVDPATGGMRPHFSLYLQRPEVVESLYYMYRLTGDQAYREAAWGMFTAIERHTRQEAGYSGLRNAMEDPPDPDDLQQSWFLAETLKYMWLIFSPPEALPLDKWVLNTEAHPLRVIGGGVQ